MKPTKILRFCVACKKQKMLFETKSKADNFISFNKTEILEENGKAPVRSYYCTLCCGWHVTSNPSTEAGERYDNYDQSVVNRITYLDQSKQDIAAIKERISSNFKKFDVALRLFNFEEAEDILCLCELAIEDMKSFRCHPDKIYPVQDRVTRAHERLDKRREMFEMDEKIQEELLSKEEPTKDELKNIKIIKDARAIKIINNVVANRTNLVNCPDNQIVHDILTKCETYIGSLSVGEGAKQAKAILRNQVEEIKKERKKCQRDYLEDDTCSSTEQQNHILPSCESEYDEEQKGEEQKQYSKEERANILSLIGKLEKIQAEYEGGNFSSCEDTLDICYYILEDLGIDDSNTQFIKSQLDLWKEKIEGIE